MSVSNNSPQQFYLVGSNDGLNWTLIDSETLSVNAAVSFSTSGNVPYFSYFRLIVTQNFGGSYAQIFQWQLYGSIQTQATITAGITGPTGVYGWTSFTGATGALGQLGYTAQTGYTGVTGYSGYSGWVGCTSIYTGVSGRSGVTGPTGAVGLTGPWTGTTGYTGRSPGTFIQTGPNFPLNGDAYLRCYYPFDTNTYNYASGSAVNDLSFDYGSLNYISTNNFKVGVGAILLSVLSSIRYSTTISIPSAYTFACWGYIGNQNSFITLYNQSLFYYPNLIFSVNGLNYPYGNLVLRMYFQRDGTAYDIVIGNVPTNIWTHVAFTYNNGVFSFYINGSLCTVKYYIGGSLQTTSTEITVTPCITAVFTNFAINDTPVYRNGNFSPYNNSGILDDWRLYFRVLSSTEISALTTYVNFPLNYPASGLIRYYPFDVNVSDYSSGSAVNNLVAYGSAVNTSSTYKVGSGCLSFPGGTGNYYTLPINNLNFSNGFTFGAWLYRNSSTSDTNSTLLSLGSSSSSYYLNFYSSYYFASAGKTRPGIRINSPGQYIDFVFDDYYLSWYYASIISNGTKWYLYFYNNPSTSISNISYYVNGTFITTGINYGPYVYFSDAISLNSITWDSGYIGRSSYASDQSGNGLNGYIDDWRLYNVQLSNTQINHLIYNKSSDVNNLSGNYTIQMSFNPTGYSGYTGVTGVTGMTGQTGPVGWTSSWTGVTGTSGPSGLSGFSGASGWSGFSGASGCLGDTGPTNVTGVSGITGSSGFTGVSGLTGMLATGVTGATGFTGWSATTGTSGITGTTGIAGFNNSVAAGVTGFQYTNSLQGPTVYSGNVQALPVPGNAFSSDTLVVSGSQNSWANGSYLLSGSSYQSASGDYYVAFSGNISTGWNCGINGNNVAGGTYTQNPYDSSGNYIGGGSGKFWSTTVQGVGTISGEYLQFSLPTAVSLTNYILNSGAKNSYGSLFINAHLWIDANNSNCYDNSSNIQYLYDQSGKNNNTNYRKTIGSGSSKITLVNGYKYINLNNVGFLIGHNGTMSTYSGNVYSLFCVINIISNATYPRIFAFGIYPPSLANNDNWTVQQWILYINAPNLNIGRGKIPGQTVSTNADTTITPFSNLNNNPGILSIWFDGTNLYGRLNGNTPVSSSSTGNFNINFIGINNNVFNPYVTSGGDQNSGNMSYAEFISYTYSPSITQIQQVEGYLATKWGLRGSLPSSHPYSNSGTAYTGTLQSI
jgi:hypothetical protein